jgi:hypothetical protein
MDNDMRLSRSILTFARTLSPIVALASLVYCAPTPPPDATGFIVSDENEAVGESQQAIEVAFRPHIQADLAELGCAVASCHGGPALPMPLIDHPEADADWEANYLQVRDRAGTIDESPMLDKAQGDGGHIAPLEEDHPAVQRWVAWIDAGAPYDLDGTVVNASGSGSSSGTGSGSSSSSGSGSSSSSSSGSSGGGGSGGGVAAVPITWDDDVYPLLVANACHDCHGSGSVQGAYSLASYQSAMGFGSDSVPNVVPGDATSTLIEYAEDGHHGIKADDALVILSWIVDWDAREN